MRSVVLTLGIFFFLSCHHYGCGSAVHYDTIIVGMGAAGSAAASSLAQAGRKVLGLEAQGYVGGRVKTNVSLTPDGIVEMGAECAFLDMVDLIVDNDKGTTNWNQFSTQSQYEELGGHQQISWHKYGYKTLFEILLNTYKNGPGYRNLNILLNKEVVHILWPTEPKWLVVVTCKDGTVYSAINVIITVSIGVLKERFATLFTPNLPPKKTNAIEHISMGTVGKIILTFDQSWWPETCSYIGFIWSTKDRIAVHPNDYWTTRILATCPKASPKSITLWTNGEVTKEVENLPEDTVRTKVMALLTKFMAFNATLTKPISILRSSWYSNPFTRGTYSYDNLLTPIYPTARYDLATPLLDSAGIPRVLFAGEATSIKHFSTVHGAIESGYREANRILNITRN